MFILYADAACFLSFLSLSLLVTIGTKFLFNYFTSSPILPLLVNFHVVNFRKLIQ